MNILCYEEQQPHTCKYKKEDRNLTSCEICAFNLSRDKAYHRTDSKNLESILKHGLKIEYGRDGKYVYLSTNKKDWLGDILFEVDIKGLSLSALEHWQLASLVDISPSRIKLLEE